MGRRRRRSFRLPEQLSLPLVWLPAPVAELERVQVGHFVAIRFSDQSWHLTVAPPQDVYYVQEHTPQQWWADAAPNEFTLHDWSSCKTKIVAERDEPELEPRAIDQRATATRWLRSFNEAFQTWRMQSSW